MDSSTITIIVTVGFLACLVIGFLRGFFKGAVKSGIDTLLGVLAVALSFPVTRIIMGVLVNPKFLSFVANEIMAILPSGFDEYAEAFKGYLSSPESGSTVEEILQLIAALPTIFLAPLVFLLVFAILALVLFGMGFFVKMFINSKKQKIGWRLFGGAIGAFTYMLVLTVIIIPINGYANTVNDTATHVLEVIESNPQLSGDESSENEVDGETNEGGGIISASSEESSDYIDGGNDYTDGGNDYTDGESGEPIEDTQDNIDNEYEAIITSLELVIEYSSVCKDSPILSTIHSFGGKKLFTSLTTVKTATAQICLEKELHGLIDLCNLSLKFTSTSYSEYGEEQAEAIREADEILSSSDYLPELVSRAISFASTEFYVNGEFFGVEKPNLGDDFNPAFDRVLRVLKSTDADDLRKDIDTFSGIASEALESGVVRKISANEINVYEILDNKELYETIFVELYKNTRTRNLIPYVTSYITDYIYALYDDMNETSTDVPEFDYTHYDEERMYLEAVYVTNAIEEIYAFINTVDTTDDELDPKQIIMEGDFAALGRGLENMRDSIFTDRIFSIVVYAVLHSELADKLAIVDEQLIENANKEDADLEGMLVARQNIMKLAISIQEIQNRDQTNMLIDSVLESLLNEDTSALTAIVSSDNLKIMGMSSQQAESIEGIVGSMVHGASGFEFESDEEKQEEIKKTEEIIFAIGNTVLDEDREHHHMFEQGDGIGSTTEMTAQDFVDSIVDSKLTSAMVQSAITNENGETVENPYNLHGEISQDDIAQLENALNNSYAHEDATEDQKATLEALASIFGVKLN